MKTNSPSHEEISLRAQEIWRSYGHPDGRDTEIWLEAERQLSIGRPAVDATESVETSEGTSRNPRRGERESGGTAVADPSEARTTTGFGSSATQQASTPNSPSSSTGRGNGNSQGHGSDPAGGQGAPIRATDATSPKPKRPSRAPRAPR